MVARLTPDQKAACSNHVGVNLYGESLPSGVIVFGSDQEVAELMKAVKRKNATGQFSWIGSDGWSARALVSKGRPSG